VASLPVHEVGGIINSLSSLEETLKECDVGGTINVLSSLKDSETRWLHACMRVFTSAPLSRLLPNSLVIILDFSISLYIFVAAR